MSGFNIIMVIAIILFARLGVRLVTAYIKMKKEDKADKEDKKDEADKEDIEDQKE
jgi:Na+/phosphate symporter